MVRHTHNALLYAVLFTGPCGSVVEHPLRDREVVGSNPGRAIPKALKMVPVATLLGAQHYKASTGFSSPNKYCTTNIATLRKNKSLKKSLIIVNVCIHRRTVWKTGNYAKYVILLKYRDYYYYYYYYYYYLRQHPLPYMSTCLPGLTSLVVAISHAFHLG